MTCIYKITKCHEKKKKKQYTVQYIFHFGARLEGGDMACYTQLLLNIHCCHVPIQWDVLFMGENSTNAASWKWLPKPLLAVHTTISMNN